MEDNVHVGILMGSDSDYEVMIEAGRALKELGISFEMMVSSAHRTPERTAEYVKNAPKRGIKLFIVGAGAAAHLRLGAEGAADNCAPRRSVEDGDVRRG